MKLVCSLAPLGYAIKKENSYDYTLKVFAE